MLFAILIFAVFAVIILVVYTSTSQPNLLMTAFGLSNGVFSLENTPAERNLSAAPIITTTKNSTLSRLYTIPLGYGEPESITVNPKTNRVYPWYTNDNGTTNFVAVIDGQTNEIINNITLPMPVGTEGYSKEVDINPQTNRLYVDDGDRTGLVVIDTSKNQITGSLKETSGPNSISVNSNANRVYAINSDYNGNNHPISNKTTSKLFSIDGNSNKILSILHLNTILKILLLIHQLT